MKPGINPAYASHSADDLSISSQTLVEIMREVLRREVDFCFRARGLSMTPFIKDGDLIAVSPVSKARPALGMVVAFVQPTTGTLMVHRIVKVMEENYLIQGDNTGGKPDGLFRQEDILGCITRVERDGRRVVLGLGPERYLVAILSRSGILRGLLWVWRKLRNRLSRK